MISAAEKSDLISGSKLHPNIQNRVVGTRLIGETSLQNVSKTGSSLHILESENEERILRNGLLSREAMAVWELLHDDLAEMFPPELRQEIFGVTEQPQVAPILEKDGKTRIYYQENRASAYSKLVGLDTNRLADVWGLREVLQEYTIQKYTPETGYRNIDASAYHMAKDLTAEQPEIGNDGELMGLLEAYWDEFSKENETFIPKELLQKRELTSLFGDNDKNISVSLQMLKTSHEITAFLRKKYAEHQAQPDDQAEWEGVPMAEVLLFLLHLFQSMEQKTELWWLGIAHGHAHSGNAVSRVAEPGSHSFPLETRIIDFDRATINANKLGNNHELYQLIDPSRVLEKIRDVSAPIELRMDMVMYLPLAAWDQDIFALVEDNQKNEHAWDIDRLISLRANPELNTPEACTQFATFIYEHEKKKVDEKSFPAFELTTALVRHNPGMMLESSPDLKAVDEYFTTGVVTESLITLSAMEYFGHKGKTELEYAMELTQRKDILGKHAYLYLNKLLQASDHALLNTIEREAKQSGDTTFLKEMMEKIYGIGSDQLFNIKMGIFYTALNGEPGQMSKFLSSFDFKKMEPEQAQHIFADILERIRTNPLFGPEEKMQLFKEFDKNREKSLPLRARLRRSIQKALTSK
ncbi:hypothetical protein BH10PAT2_BH10PAT2_1350 [soil metagenome]